MANGIKCGLRPCFNYMFASTVVSPAQHVIGHTGKLERMERAILFLYVYMSLVWRV